MTRKGRGTTNCHHDKDKEISEGFSVSKFSCRIGIITLSISSYSCDYATYSEKYEIYYERDRASEKEHHVSYLEIAIRHIHLYRSIS